MIIAHGCRSTTIVVEGSTADHGPGQLQSAATGAVMIRSPSREDPGTGMRDHTSDETLPQLIP